MNKTVLITREFDWIDKSRWPAYVRDFISNPDPNSIHGEHGSKLAYHKFNTDAYPRLVFFEEKDQAGNTVYVVRKYFESHDQYDLFRKLPEEEKRRKCKYSPLDEEEVKIKKIVVVEKKQPLPDWMRDYEKQRDFSHMATTYVFEMEEWCNHFKRKELEDDRKEIYEVVSRIVLEKEYGSVDAEGWHQIHFAGQKTIVFRVHSIEGHAYYYLFDLGNEVDLDNLNNKYLYLDEESLLKQARKGYPDWILCGDFEDWKRLEQDDEANLALSDEEIKVLNSTPYPYFVNGLAGSGKSTILYYLFAHAYSYKAIKPMDLLFLSYSPKLIVKAKSVIKALLKTNPSYHGFKLTEEEERRLNACFWDFQKFLTVNFLDTAEELDRFDTVNHVSYDQFQKDYALTCPLVEANRYKAAMVWSVIRSYIKGRNFKRPFTADDYATLNLGDRTVETEDFKNIYKIWKNWYVPTYEKKGKWDDLDLVAYVLNKIDKGISYPQYDIVYCDEAQDFTPIENQLILHLSKYTNFDLCGYNHIPIAYAGDPNQTVSPTGFNWKRLKYMFDHTFSALVGHHISLDEKTLNNNYRSKRTIVEFANSLQYIRKCFLSNDVLKPQEQWNPQENTVPGFFYLSRFDGQADDSATIKTSFDKAECIITGADGEYVPGEGKNQLAPESTPIDDALLQGIKNKTILYTAVSSKGLEFKAVLLYRFADQLPQAFEKMLNREEITDESDRYELSHFFTKLYIAVSRAKEVLYIIDSQENYERFWKYFIDNAFVNKLLNNRTDAEGWRNKVGGIKLGDQSEFLSQMEGSFNPLERALKIFDDAKLEQNAKDMARAAGYFEMAGDRRMAEESKAFVQLYQHNYRQAGEKFMLLGMKSEAIDAFWNGCCWNELMDQDDRADYRLAAQFMTGRLPLLDFVKNEELVQHIVKRDETWNKVVAQIDQKAKHVPADWIHETCAFLEQLAGKGFMLLNSTIADLYFRGKQYAKAVEKWDELADTHNDSSYREQRDYYQAKEELSGTPSEKIFWMSKGGKNKEILQHYASPRDAKTNLLDDQARKIVFSLLVTPRTFEQALAYPVDDEFKYYSLYRNASTRLQFIDQVLLNDFDELKFRQWIEEPVRHGDNIFDGELPASLFERIFSLPKMEDWILFMKLRDNGDYRVMRNEINANKVSDAISKVLSKKNYLSLASCFLDVVFNSPYYNEANAKKYVQTLFAVFDKNPFSVDDFVLASKRNSYFSAAELTGRDVDTIKVRLREFVKAYIRHFSKIKQRDVSAIETLCHIYEKTAPRIQDAQGKYVYDRLDVLSFYNDMLKRKDLPAALVKFIKVRKEFVDFRQVHESLEAFADALKSDKLTINDAFGALDRADALYLVKLAFGKYRYDREAVVKSGAGLLAAKLGYKFKMTLSDFEQSTTKAYVRRHFADFAEQAIEALLQGEPMNEEAIKLYAYVYEAFHDKPTAVARRYSSLVRLKALSKHRKLVEYLQQRELHFLAYGDERVFVKKAVDYESPLTIEDARAEVYPHIDLGRVDKAPAKAAETFAKLQGENKGGVKPPKPEKGHGLTREQEQAKAVQLAMALSLKQSGVADELILKSAKLLTKADLSNL